MDGPGPRRERDAGAARVEGIGRDAIKVADAAGRQHRVCAGEPMRPIFRVDAEHAPRLAVIHHDFIGGNALDHLDRRRLPHPLRQRLHDRPAGGVALDPNDAAMRVRRLARGLQHAKRVAVERRAVCQKIVDPRPRLQRHAERDVGVDEAGAGGDGVGGVNLRRVALRDRRRDAALRPGRGPANAGRREDFHPSWREFQRAENPGETAADNDHRRRMVAHAL